MEKTARSLPIYKSTFADIEKLQRRSLEAGRVATANEQARDQETQVLGAVQVSLTDWLAAELEKVALAISSDSIRCAVRAVGMPSGEPLRVQTGDGSILRALNGVELIFDDVNDPSNREHALQLLLCKHEQFVTRNHAAFPKIEPVRDFKIAVLPFYRQTLKHRHPNSPSAAGYISRKDMIGTMRGHVEMPSRPGRATAPQVHTRRVELVSASFDDAVTLHIVFNASEWPGSEDRLRGMLKDAIQLFVTRINTVERNTIPV